MVGARKKENREPLTTRQKLVSIMVSGSVMAAGLLLFKAAPMYLWGSDITFDASFHIVFVVFALHVCWFFVDQVPVWRMPFLVVSTGVVVIVALHRIIEGAHDEFGVMLGLMVACTGVVAAHWPYFSGRLSF